AACARAHDRDVRAHVPDRWTGFADARRRFVLRSLRRRCARTAIGRRDGDDLHGRHADLAADRAALRQPDAARLARQGASANSCMSPQGRPWPAAARSPLALAIAGWIRYASRAGEDGTPIAVSDPLSARFASVAAAANGNAAQIADGFLDLAEVFGAELPAN